MDVQFIATHAFEQFIHVSDFASSHPLPELLGRLFLHVADLGNGASVNFVNLNHLEIIALPDAFQRLGDQARFSAGNACQIGIPWCRSFRTARRHSF
jgi:hypothetical protein